MSTQVDRKRCVHIDTQRERGCLEGGTESWPGPMGRLQTGGGLGGCPADIEVAGVCWQNKYNLTGLS